MNREDVRRLISDPRGRALYDDQMLYQSLRRLWWGIPMFEPEGGFPMQSCMEIGSRYDRLASKNSFRILEELQRIDAERERRR